MPALHDHHLLSHLYMCDLGLFCAKRGGCTQAQAYKGSADRFCMPSSTQAHIRGRRLRWLFGTIPKLQSVIIRLLGAVERLIKLRLYCQMPRSFHMRDVLSQHDTLQYSGTYNLVLGTEAR